MLNTLLMSKTTFKIDKSLKEPIIKWQGWLQSKLGKKVSQGQAVAFACAVAHSIVEGKSAETEIKELEDHISKEIFEGLAEIAEEEAEEDG